MKFGLCELVNISKEGMDMLVMKYDGNVWKKTFVERFQEYLIRYSTSDSIFHRTLLGYYAEGIHANC